MKEKIDIVISWVDGNDPIWKEEYMKYSALEREGDKRIIRYRDWDNLQYIFRGIDTFMPWVNKVHIITYGHIPKWLNIDCEKLNIVKHSDILPSNRLPVFSSGPIEINMHKIEGMQDKFIYFNDDMFVLKKTPISRFFSKGLPVDIAVQEINIVKDMKNITNNQLLLQKIGIINSHFPKKRNIILSDFSKWFSLKYKLTDLVENLIFLIHRKHFIGFKAHHQPQGYLKKTFEEVWAKETTLLSDSIKLKFRNSLTIHQWIFRYWHIAKGEFTPNGYRDSISVTMNNKENINSNKKLIEDGKYRFVCLNDEANNDDFEFIKKEINKSLNMVLPNKSKFEK